MMFLRYIGHPFWGEPGRGCGVAEKEPGSHVHAFPRKKGKLSDTLTLEHNI